MSTQKEMELFEKRIVAAVETLKKHQDINSSERYSNSEINEANLTHHIAGELIKHGEYYVAAEYPLPMGMRLDLMSYHLGTDPWIGIEVKNRLHSNSGPVLGDLKRLAYLDQCPEFEDDVIKVMLVMNRYPELSAWWSSRGEIELQGIAAIQRDQAAAPGEYKEIGAFLQRPGSLVGRVEWATPEGDCLYEVLYVVFS
ncbi:hypothetical protein ACRYJU_04645 [Alloalcanivorax xenomutans]|uniref:Uncharacterized protein n=1 Tax=Alcanivorax xiamenensis TaxID=1177156 RepID=A0ABQ6Y578_9GAMM|nr:hypothetical protein [Alcanivorax xiamenensis]KAF0804385.1 hypothetical protein A6D6_03122 [Alcanivorax xiamenensis]